jgi:hypothetical protein
MKRIRFTRAELELILDMAQIAEFGPWGEGDYQGWDDGKTEKVFNSLRYKARELIARADVRRMDKS